MALGTTGAGIAKTLTVGSISNDPADEIAEWHPFAKFLAESLTDRGIDGGRVLVARDAAEMIGMLRRGEVDLYIDSPIIALIVSASSGSKLLLRRWKKGKASYSSVIFARADSDLASLADLAGRVIAFQDEHFTSAYFLPRLALQRAGMTIMPIARPGTTVAKDKVGFAFSQKDENTRGWVLRGLVDAGATGNRKFASWNEQGELKVLFETDEVPRQVVTHRQNLTPQLVARIREVLLSMHLSEAGREVLKLFERTDRFDEIPPEQRAAMMRIAKSVGEFGS